MAQTVPSQVDLLLTDVITPSMNGQDPAKKVSSANPALECLFTSRYAADSVECRGLGRDEVLFLERPFSVGALAERVRCSRRRR